MSIRRAGRSKRMLLVLGIIGLTLMPAGPAAAHVHGITPLRCVGVADDGANATNDTPAAAANGGPIAGLIPSTVGAASHIVPGTGGFDTPACPA